VPRRGLEPPPLARLVPETSASTNSATWALGVSYEAGARLVNRAHANSPDDFPCGAVFATYIISRFVLLEAVMSSFPRIVLRKISAAFTFVGEALRDLVAPPPRLIPIPVRKRRRPPHDPR